MALPEVSSEELYRQMANDIVDYLMGDMSCRYVRFFRQTPEELYNALTTDTVCVSSIDNLHNDAEVGSYIMLGNLEIQFLRLVPNKTIHMLWKLQTWPDSFFSRADLVIEQIEDFFTRVEVTFSGLPLSPEESEVIWGEEVWRPIIDAFAYRDNLIRWAASLE